MDQLAEQAFAVHWRERLQGTAFGGDGNGIGRGEPDDALRVDHKDIALADRACIKARVIGLRGRCEVVDTVHGCTLS